MKDFIKMVLAVFCAMILLSVISIVLTVGAVSSMALASESKTVLPKSGVLNMDFSKFSISEQTKEADPVSMIRNDETENIGIWDAVQALNQAAEDPAVKFIYLRPEGAATSISQLQEIRKSLDNCKKKGKAIIAYLNNPSTGSYYIASVADKIYLSSAEGSSSMILGISGQLTFLKDLLDKVGISMQLIRHGKYKSAGETFIKNAPSPENLEQNQVMISSIWNSLATEITDSREISVEKLNSLLDNLELNFSEDLIDNKLADGALSKQELEDKLADLATVEDFKDIKFISFSDYVSAKVTPNAKAKQKIAIIYADGEIVDGKEPKDVAGDRFASVIAKVRKDSTVKAVVLRVNSPGGSVVASDKIKKELDLLGAEKPLVASYGSMAASGGYWISNNCKKIFSNETTLTGSIGVFSMIPDLSKAYKETLHINKVAVNSNKHSDMYSGARPLDDDEIAYAQASVERIYEAFVNAVAAGRDLEPSFVDSIAQGRVWTGSDALKIGLVDEIGTLEDAVNFAMIEASEDLSEAELSKWKIVGYPKPQTTMEMLMEKFNKTNGACIFAGTDLEDTERCLRSWAECGENGIALARIPYLIDIR